MHTKACKNCYTYNPEETEASIVADRQREGEKRNEPLNSAFLANELILYEIECIYCITLNFTPAVFSLIRTVKLISLWVLPTTAQCMCIYVFIFLRTAVAGFLSWELPTQSKHKCAAPNGFFRDREGGGKRRKYLRIAMVVVLLRAHNIMVLYQNASVGICTVETWSVHCHLSDCVFFCDKTQFVRIDTTDRVCLFIQLYVLHMWETKFWKFHWIDFRSLVRLNYNQWDNETKLCVSKCMCAHSLSTMKMSWIFKITYIFDTIYTLFMHWEWVKWGTFASIDQLISVKRVCTSITNVWWTFGAQYQSYRDRSSVRHGTPCDRTLKMAYAIFMRIRLYYESRWSSVYLGTHSNHIYV